MKHFKITMIVFLFLLGTIAFGQELGIRPDFSTQRMNPIMLKEEINKLKLENFGSGVLTLGGVASMGVGAVSTYIGYTLLDNVINEDNGIADIFGLLIGTEFLAAGIILVPAGLIVTSIFIDNIRNNNKMIGEMQFILKNYHSLSYQSRSGIGIGMSFPLNFH